MGWDEYYIRQRDGTIQGPYDEARVRRYIAEGRARPDMWYSSDGEFWTAGTSLPHLFPLSPAPASQEPPAPVRPTRSPARRTRTRTGPPSSKLSLVAPLLVASLVLVAAVWAINSVPFRDAPPTVGEASTKEPADGGTKASPPIRDPAVPPEAPHTPVDQAAQTAERLRLEFRRSTADAIERLRADVAEATAHDLDTSRLKEAIATLSRGLRDVDPADPTTWAIPTAAFEAGGGVGFAPAGWRVHKSMAKRARTRGERAVAEGKLADLVRAWRTYLSRSRRCHDLLARALPVAEETSSIKPAAGELESAESKAIQAAESEADRIEDELADLRQMVRSSSLDGPPLADALKLFSAGLSAVAEAQHSLSAASRLLTGDADDVASLLSRYIEDAEHSLALARGLADEIRQFLKPPVPEFAELEDVPDGLDVSKPDAGATSDKAKWPSAKAWGKPTEQDAAQLDRPVFGLRVTNKVAKVNWVKKKYIWTDPWGRRWTRYRRNRDGEIVTLYIRVTAVDVPSGVMGLTGEIVFSAGATTGEMTFPVRSIPLRPGETQTQKVEVHVPEATITREQGNWLRKVAMKDLDRHTAIRLGRVRFLDGRAITYRHEPTIASGDKALGKPLRAVVHAAGSGGTKEKKKKSAISNRRAVDVVPYSRGRVWVPPQRTRSGMWVSGHWRRRPSGP